MFVIRLPNESTSIDFAFDAIWQLLRLRPGQFHELILLRAQLIRRKTEAKPRGDGRHDIAAMKGARHRRQPMPRIFDADDFRGWLEHRQAT